MISVRKQSIFPLDPLFATPGYIGFSINFLLFGKVRFLIDFEAQAKLIKSGDLAPEIHPLSLSVSILYFSKKSGIKIIFG